MSVKPWLTLERRRTITEVSSLLQKKVLDLVKLLSAGRKLNEVHHEH